MTNKLNHGTANSITPTTPEQKNRKKAWIQAPKRSQGMGTKLSGNTASRPIHKF